MSMKITICGGGNAAHTLAGLLGSKPDVSVKVYAPLDNEADRWQAGIRQHGGITVHMPQGSLLGRPDLVSRDAGEAISGSELVILALPAFAHQAILEKIAPYLARGAWVGALPARGGFDLGAHAVLGERAVQVALFGFQTLPWACRIQLYGQEATVLGAKDQVDIAAWPAAQTKVIAARLQQLLGVRLNPVSSFLSLTLADTGQIIHPGIMFGLFRDWDGQPFPAQKLFYQGVTESIADILQQMSDEIQVLRAMLVKEYPDLDLSAARPLDEWLMRSYPSTIADPRTLQSRFATNKSYAGLLAPMKSIDGGFVPDFQARYLAEDVPFDLLVTRGIAELAGTATPMIDSVISWAQAQLGKEFLSGGRLIGKDLDATRAPQRFGLTDLDQLVRKMGYLKDTPVVHFSQSGP
jgi:hypothetical protein